MHPIASQQDVRTVLLAAGIVLASFSLVMCDAIPCCVILFVDQRWNQLLSFINML
jgi:hypothetical protein